MVITLWDTRKIIIKEIFINGNQRIEDELIINNISMKKMVLLIKIKLIMILI